MPACVQQLAPEGFWKFEKLGGDCQSLAGSALTTFNKGGVDLSPTVIAHRSSYTRGELLINPKEYESFKHKVHIIDRVWPSRAAPPKGGACGNLRAQTLMWRRAALTITLSQSTIIT